MKYLIGSSSFVNSGSRKWVNESELVRLSKSIEYTIYAVKREDMEVIHDEV